MAIAKKKDGLKAVIRMGVARVLFVQKQLERHRAKAK